MRALSVSPIGVTRIVFQVAGIVALFALSRCSNSLDSAGAPSNVSASSSTVGELSLYQLGSVWTTDDNRSIKFVELRGHSQVLALIFTACTGTCPLTVKELQTFEASLPEKIARQTRFVLVTIDPADTIDVLRGYRQTMKLDDRFMLLRGTSDSVRELAAILGFNYEKDGDQYAHTNLVTVLDIKGNIVHQQSGAGGSRSDLLAAVERSLKP